VSVLVSLDGVMMRMNAETADGKATDAGCAGGIMVTFLEEVVDTAFAD